MGLAKVQVEEAGVTVKGLVVVTVQVTGVVEEVAAMVRATAPAWSQAMSKSEMFQPKS